MRTEAAGQSTGLPRCSSRSAAATTNDSRPGERRRLPCLPEAAGVGKGEYRKAHKMFAEGELDGFIATDDNRSKQQKKRLLATREDFIGDLSYDALTLEIEEDET